MINELKNYIWAGNSAYDYLLAVVIFLGVIIVLKIFQAFILLRLRRLALKTKSDLDDILIEIFQQIKPPFYFFAALYSGIKVLILPDIVHKVLIVLITVSVVYESVVGLQKLIDYFLKKHLKKVDNTPEGKKQSKAMINALGMIAKVALWLIGITLVLANLGINVTSIVASLGIGGIAIALALQNILGDLFSSFSIYLDKPFMIGDFVVLGQDSGTVEKIGLKTTRIRTLQGEELIIPNNELTNSRIHNYKTLEKRRHSFVVGVTYETSGQNLRKIPKLMKEIINKEKLAEFQWCYFKEFADSALNYETVFYATTKDYEEFVKLSHKINLAIMSKFKEVGIEFAYPTQTVHLSQE